MRNLALPISGDRHDTRSLVLPWHLATLLSYPPSLLGAAKESDERSVDIIQLTGQLNVRLAADCRDSRESGRPKKKPSLFVLFRQSPRTTENSRREFRKRVETRKGSRVRRIRLHNLSILHYFPVSAHVQMEHSLIPNDKQGCDRRQRNMVKQGTILSRWKADFAASGGGMNEEK